MEEAKRVFDAYQIIEREGLEKAIWNKVGVGFQNRDQSINVLLDAFPKDGKLQLRDRKENGGHKKHAPDK